MIIVKMVQQNKHVWRIESQSGAVLQGNIVMHSPSDAEEYVIKYISSFSGWSYVIIKMEGV